MRSLLRRLFPKKRAENFVVFRGALMDVDDDGNVSYTPRKSVIVNTDQIGAAFDHTVIVMGHKIRVMEELEEIGNKIGMW